MLRAVEFSYTDHYCPHEIPTTPDLVVLTLQMHALQKGLLRSHVFREKKKKKNNTWIFKNKYESYTPTENKVTYLELR